jgi:hypothetical protein
MRKDILSHIVVISFIFFLSPIKQAAGEKKSLRFVVLFETKASISETIICH